MTRTKKTPSSQSLAARATKGPLETPKGSVQSVLPAGLEDRVAVPLVLVDADAGRSPEVRDAGAALVWLSANGRDEDVTTLLMDVRNALATKVHAALGSSYDEIASVMTDVVLRQVVQNVTPKAVQDVIRRQPSLVLETKRLVEATEKARRLAS